MPRVTMYAVALSDGGGTQWECYMHGEQHVHGRRGDPRGLATINLEAHLMRRHRIDLYAPIGDTQYPLIAGRKVQ